MDDQLRKAIDFMNGGGWTIRGGKEAFRHKGATILQTHLDDKTLVLGLKDEPALNLGRDRLTKLSGVEYDDPFIMQFKGQVATQAQKKKRDGGGMGTAMQEISLLTVWNDAAHARYEVAKELFAREARRARDLGMSLDELRAHDARAERRRSALKTHVDMLNLSFRGLRLDEMRVVDGVITQIFTGDRQLRVILVDAPPTERD